MRPEFVEVDGKMFVRQMTGVLAFKQYGEKMVGYTDDHRLFVSLEDGFVLLDYEVGRDVADFWCTERGDLYVLKKHPQICSGDNSAMTAALEVRASETLVCGFLPYQASSVEWLNPQRLAIVAAGGTFVFQFDGSQLSHVSLVDPKDTRLAKLAVIRRNVVEIWEAGGQNILWQVGYVQKPEGAQWRWRFSEKGAQELFLECMHCPSKEKGYSIFRVAARRWLKGLTLVRS